MVRLFFGMMLALFVSTAQARELGTHVCDRDYEAALFAEMLGNSPSATAEKVNTEVNSPDACVASLFLLIKGDAVATIRTHAALWKIHKVYVMAVWQNGWKPVPLQEYFTAFPQEEA